MHIDKVHCHLLRLPLSRTILTPNKDGTQNEHLFVLVVQLQTDRGMEGLGVSWTHQVGGRALHALANDDLAPLFLNEDPLDHERLCAKADAHLREIGSTSLAARAYAAFDIALWDLKGKTAGLPLHKLLGGARSGIPAYASDVGWRWMSPKQVVEAAQSYLNQGLAGVKVHVGRTDPEEDAHRLTYIREALGEHGWLGVDADRRYDFATALLMGEFLEENGMDWFEEPIAAADLPGLSRLATKMQVPLALGQSFDSAAQFLPFLERGVGDVIQPSVMQLGGITGWLKAATLAELHHRPVVPAGLPEIAVQLGCAVSVVKMIPCCDWLAPLFRESLKIENGLVLPPSEPGLGLTLKSEALEQFKCQ
jgi:L-alanine-DL-glutamate epimerase-like enolase superfamily enzyme